jgi:hypothetical protein
LFASDATMAALADCINNYFRIGEKY